MSARNLFRPSRWLVVLLGAGLATCAGGPPPSSISEARNQATAYALTQRAFALALAKQCSFDPASGSDLSQPARDAMEAWDRRNRARSTAVNLYLEDYLAVVARREGRDKVAARRGEVTRRSTQNGNAAAQRAIDAAGGRKRCPELLQSLEGGELDGVSEEFDPVLEQLVVSYPR